MIRLIVLDEGVARRHFFAMICSADKVRAVKLCVFVKFFSLELRWRKLMERHFC